MQLPAFTADGDLAPGIYQVSLKEILERFGAGSAQRISVGTRLDRIFRLAQGTGKLARFVVFGSFVTDKLEPNDVDVFIVMEDTFEASQLSGEAALLFDHAAAAAHFGASIFWLRRLAAMGGEQSTIEYWQVKRGGGRRGIVEIVGWGT